MNIQRTSHALLSACFHLFITQNEQITISANDGLTLGMWTIRVQAKLLPNSGSQDFSLVVTADGVVIPPVGGVGPGVGSGVQPTAVSPSILLQCQKLVPGEDHPVVILLEYRSFAGVTNVLHDIMFLLVCQILPLDSPIPIPNCLLTYPSRSHCSIIVYSSSPSHHLIASLCSLILLHTSMLLSATFFLSRTDSAAMKSVLRLMLGKYTVHIVAKLAAD